MPLALPPASAHLNNPANRRPDPARPTLGPALALPPASAATRGSTETTKTSRPTLALPPASAATRGSIETTAARPSLALPPASAATRGSTETTTSRPALALPPPSAATQGSIETTKSLARPTAPTRQATPASSTPAAYTPLNTSSPVATHSTKTTATPRAKFAGTRGKKIRPYVLACRYGCDKPLSNEAAVRVHMRKVHNLFEPGVDTMPCGACGKLFAKQIDFDRHARTFCFDTDKTRWDVARPETQQEHADTWALKSDGEMSAECYIWLDDHGQPLDPQPKKVPQSASAASTQQQLGKRRREGQEAEEELPTKKTTKRDSGIATPSEPLTDGGPNSRSAVESQEPVLNAFQPTTIGSNALPPNALPPNALPPNAFSPQAFQQNAMLPNALPPNTLPANALPPNAGPPNGFQPNAYAASPSASSTLAQASSHPPTPTVNTPGFDAIPAHMVGAEINLAKPVADELLFPTLEATSSYEGYMIAMDAISPPEIRMTWLTPDWPNANPPVPVDVSCLEEEDEQGFWRAMAAFDAMMEQRGESRERPIEID